MSSKPRKTAVGHTTNEFLSKHHVPTKIAAGLKRLGEGWLYEYELVKLCGISQQQFSAYKEQFKDHIVRDPESERDKRVWAGTKAYATKLRKRMGA